MSGVEFDRDSVDASTRLVRIWAVLLGLSVYIPHESYRYAVRHGQKGEFNDAKLACRKESL